MDLDDRDYTFDGRWFEVIRFSNLPYVYAILGHISLFSRDLQIFMELHDFPHLWDAHWDDDLLATLSWYHKKASLEPFSQTHTFQHLDVIMFLLLGDASLICWSDSAGDMDG